MRRGGETYTSLRAQDKKCQNKLRKHPHNNSLPIDCLTIAGCSIEGTYEDEQTEKGDSTICPSIIGGFRTGKSTSNDDSNSSSGTERKSGLLWDQLDRFVDGIDPDEDNRLGDVFSRDVQGDEANSESKPDKEGDEPAKVLAMENETGDPPSG